MKITLTKENWDAVTKVLRDFIESSDEIVICHYDYSEAYIGRLFDDPRNGIISIRGAAADDTRISIGLGDVLDVMDTEIWFYPSEDETLGLGKRSHTEDEKRLCYTQRTPLLLSIYNSINLSPKAKSLSSLLASELFERIPVPRNDGMRLVKYKMWFDPSENFHRVGLSLKEGIKLQLEVHLKYPKHPVNQLPCSIDPIGYNLIKEKKTSGGVVYSSEFFTYYFDELIMEIARCTKQ